MKKTVELHLTHITLCLCPTQFGVQMLAFYPLTASVVLSDSRCEQSPRWKSLTQQHLFWLTLVLLLCPLQQYIPYDSLSKISSFSKVIPSITHTCHLLQDGPSLPLFCSTHTGLRIMGNCRTAHLIPGLDWRSYQSKS